MKKDTAPLNWNKDRVQQVLQHYETQTEDEAVVEDELMWEEPKQTIMEVPTKLVPVVRELIAKHNKV